MAQQSTIPAPAGNSLHELEQLARRCKSSLEEWDGNIRDLEASLREAQERRNEIATMCDDTQTVTESLRSVLERARRLGLAESPPGGAARLHVVPEEPFPTEDPEQPEPPEEVLIRGAVSQALLNALATRPDLAWGSEDVADIMGIEKDDKEGRKRLRSNLRNLYLAGALERITQENDNTHVYYRPRMNWRFV